MRKWKRQEQEKVGKTKNQDTAGSRKGISRSLSCCSTIKKKKKKKLKAEPEFLGPAIRKSLVRVVLFELKVRV